MKISNKTNEEIIDILLKTNFFKNAVIMCESLGFEHSKRMSTNLKKLSHFCEWHKEGRTKLVVDKVYDSVEKYTGFGDFIYNVGDIVKTKNGDVVILNCYISERYKYYTCKCLNDNFVFDIRQYNLRRGCGCPVCSNKKPILGFNTIYDTHPYLLKYIVNIEDAKTLTHGSHKKILCVCPNCNSTKLISAYNLCKYGFVCHVCTSGVSYPNKFIRNLLNQFKIEYYPEHNFNWSNKRLYDVYIPKYNCIIEMHGEQHYVEVKHWGSLKEVQDNDNYKKELAILNNISKYFEIDCKESNINYIKESIINSGILDFLNINEDKIDWQFIDEQSNDPIIKKSCDLLNEGLQPINIAFQLKIDYSTVLKYLKKGNQLGWCNYKSKDNLGCSKASRDNRSKPIYCPDFNIYFYNSGECTNYFNKNVNISFNRNALSDCLNKNKKYKGIQFYYIDKNLYNHKKELFDNNFQNEDYKVVGDYYFI